MFVAVVFSMIDGSVFAFCSESPICLSMSVKWVRVLIHLDCFYKHFKKAKQF